MPQVQFIRDDSERDARQQAARALSEGLRMGMAFRQQALQQELSKAQLAMAQERHQFDLRQAQRLAPLQEALLQSQAEAAKFQAETAPDRFAAEMAERRASIAASQSGIEHQRWMERYYANKAEQEALEAKNRDRLLRMQWLVGQFFNVMSIEDSAQRAQAGVILKSVAEELGDGNILKLIDDFMGPAMAPDKVVMSDLGKAMESNPELKISLLSLVLRSAFPENEEKFSVEQLMLMSEEERKNVLSQVKRSDEIDVILDAMRKVYGIEEKDEGTDEGTDKGTGKPTKVDLESAYPVPDDLLPETTLRTKTEKEAWIEWMSEENVRRASTAVHTEYFIPTANRFFEAYGKKLRSPEAFHEQTTGLTAKDFADHFTAIVGTYNKWEISDIGSKFPVLADMGLPSHVIPGGWWGRDQQSPDAATAARLREVIEYVKDAKDPREGLRDWLAKQARLEEQQKAGRGPKLGKVPAWHAGGKEMMERHWTMTPADIDTIKFVMWAGKLSRLLD